MLLFFLRIALLADFAFLLGLHTAFVFAFLASGFRLVAAGFRARDGHTAEEDEGADDCTDGLHVLPFLPPRLRATFSVCCLEPADH